MNNTFIIIIIKNIFKCKNIKNKIIIIIIKYIIWKHNL